MILTCPECATRFKIADDAIGPNGRTVRCSQCSATWFVAAEPDVLALDDAEKTVDIREDVIREAVSDIEQGGEIAGTSIDDTATGGLKTAAASVGAHATIRENADRKKARRRILGVGMIWVVTLAILALFALAAYLFRAQIVEKFPGAAPVYKAIGLEANASGLEFFDIKRRYGNNEGVPVLIVSGKIKNIDRKTHDVDMIKLSFKNEAGEVLDAWVVEPPQSILKPGKTIKFTSQYPNPPVDAAKLAAEFVSEAEMQGVTPQETQPKDTQPMASQ